MKKFAVCVVLLIAVILALPLMRRSSNDNRILEIASVPEVGIKGKLDVAHTMNEASKDTQSTDFEPSLERETQQTVVALPEEGSQMVTNDFNAKNEAPMNMPEHDEAISAVDDERHHFARIAFERAKDVIEIADMSMATVEYKDNIAIVTFPFPRQTMGDQPPYPGPDYLARVKIDRGTDNVLEILGAQ